MLEASKFVLLLVPYRQEGFDGYDGEGGLEMFLCLTKNHSRIMRLLHYLHLERAGEYIVTLGRPHYKW